MRGFIALTSVVILSAVLLASALAGSANGFYAREDALNREWREERREVARSCAAIVALKILNTENYAGGEEIMIYHNPCTVSELDRDDDIASYTVSVAYKTISIGFATEFDVARGEIVSEKEIHS